MCGIAGFWTKDAITADAAQARLETVRDSMCHRGPDDAGVWVHKGLAFGHRRLAIVDLSPLGHQPMTDALDRFTICFNGEIFNYIGLRDELRALGHSFKSASDTEVMLTAFSQWGVVGGTQRFVGMFAFSLWDEREKCLYLVRDRLGIKPLYIGYAPNGDLVFGSELKSLMAYPEFERKISPDAATAYMRYGYVPSPQSILRSAVKLPPGHYTVIKSPDDRGEAKPFWSLPDVAREGAASVFAGDLDAAEEELDALVRDAVSLRMIADVPLGAFLSGGVDSSLVVGVMQSLSKRRVKTFTIGFEEARYDESRYARAIADHLGTEHTEHRVTAAESLAVIPDLPVMYDEPLADSSQIPTYLVSALARKHVTVALSGDGGDELFGGYSRYRFAPQAWSWVSKVPGFMRTPGANALRYFAQSGVGRASGRSAKAMKTATLLQSRGLSDLYHGLVSTTANPVSLTSFQKEPVSALESVLNARNGHSAVERMMMADTMVYLPDDLLTKLDRASMAVALEGRVPLLDHRIAAFAWRLPIGMRRDKVLLRRVLSRYVPRQLFEREKMGFEVPVADWLRGPLLAWASDLLDPVSIASGGILNPSAVQSVLREHVERRANNSHLLWTLLMFEAWRREWRATLG